MPFALLSPLSFPPSIADGIARMPLRSGLAVMTDRQTRRQSLFKWPEEEEEEEDCVDPYSKTQACSPPVNSAQTDMRITLRPTPYPSQLEEDIEEGPINSHRAAANDSLGRRRNG